MNSLLGIVEPSGPSANEDSLTEFKKMMDEALNSKKTAYPEIKHLLQELVYTTCGEASLLDPLIDHLDNLLASFGTINAKNTNKI